jgi:hypothetical protein
MSRPATINLAIVLAAFVVVTLIAEVAGAANLGTAMTFGQLAFGAAMTFVLVKR